MCRTTEVAAHAKLNLTLHVLGKRPDGYHDLRMVMQSVAFGDTLRVTIGTDAPLRVTTNRSFLPTDARNLAVAAADRFVEATGIDLGGLAIAIEKRIPVCAGLGGGSSDAAAVLRALNDLTAAGLTPAQLADIGAAVGSDVPYCVLGGTALAEGRGEVLTPLAPLPRCYVVLCKPEFRISTPILFGRLNLRRVKSRPDTDGLVRALEEGSLHGVACRMYNVFEEVLSGHRGAEIAELKASLIGHGAIGAAMSGTGPTVFGLFADEAPARAAWSALCGRYRDVFLTETEQYV